MRFFSGLALSFSFVSMLTQITSATPAAAATISSIRGSAPAARTTAISSARSTKFAPVASLNLTTSSTYLPIHTVQNGFIGLSFRRNILLNELNKNNPAEITALSRLLALSGTGVLRLSGDIAISPTTGTCTTPNNTSLPLGVENLAKVLSASGWKVIYGLDVNYGFPCQATPQLAALKPSKLVRFSVQV